MDPKVAFPPSYPGSNGMKYFVFNKSVRYILLCLEIFITKLFLVYNAVEYDTFEGRVGSEFRWEFDKQRMLKCTIDV